MLTVVTMQNLTFANLAITIQNQKADRMVKGASPGEEKVVLNIDPRILDYLSTTGCVRLRLLCREGSSIMLSLKKKGHEALGGGEYRDWFLTMSLDREDILSCIDRGREFIFYNEEHQKAVYFRVAAVSPDLWLGDMKPLCERLQ